MTRPSTSRENFLEVLTDVAFSWLCLFATLWPILAKVGIPAYSHDWSWPFSSAKFLVALPAIASTWNPEGFGHANAFASANPAAFAPVLIGLAFPPKAALISLLLLVGATAGLGISQLCRQLGASRSARLLGIFVYLLSPVLYNKVAAGQTGYWLSYALLPWSTYLLIRACVERNTRSALLAYVIAGLSCVTPQFLIFGAFQSIALAAAFRTRGAAVVAAGLPIALLLLNASIIWSAIGLFSGFGYTVPSAPVRAFEMLQSASIGDAFRLIGYIIPYATWAYDRVPLHDWFVAALWVVPIAGCAGLALRYRERSAIFVLLIAVAGLLTMTGLKGPAGPIFGFAFDHFVPAAIIREFYHAGALVSLGWAAGCALLASALRRFAIPLAAVIATALFPLALGHASDLNVISAPASLTEANALVSGSPARRMLALPYKMPMGFLGDRFSGVDVLSFVDADHPDASEYGKTPELDVVAALMGEGRTSDGLTLLRRLGVGVVVRRSWLASAFAKGLWLGDQRPYAAAAHRAFRRGAIADKIGIACGVGTCARVFPAEAPVSVQTRSVRTPPSWNGVASLPTFVDAGPRALPIVQARARLTPQDGWVDASSWLWARPEWADLVDAVEVTDVPSRLDLRAPAPMELHYVSSAAIRICRATCATYGATRTPATVRIPAGDVSIIASGTAAVGTVATPATVPAELAAGTVQATRVLPWEVRGVATGSGTMLVIFRDRFDPGWQLQGLAVLAHVRIDATFNGWIVRNSGRSSFRLYYRPQGTFLLVGAFEWLAYLVLVALAFIRTFSSRSRSNTALTPILERAT